MITQSLTAIERENEISLLTSLSDGFSGAQVKEFCRRIAFASETDTINDISNALNCACKQFSAIADELRGSTKPAVIGFQI
jgi:hypothetical protein